jgi:hypothetical protein
MVKRSPDTIAAEGTRWRVGIAALAVLIVAAVTIGVGAVPVRTNVADTTPLPVPNAVLPDSPGTPTPTPRVIAVPETSTSPPATMARPTVTPTPASLALAATAPPALPTVTPTPWLMVAEEAPPATTERPATRLPAATATPSPTPAKSALPSIVALPSPTAPLPSPTVAPAIASTASRQLEFGAEDWAGGFYRGDGRAYGRRWVALYGAGSAYPRATLSFDLDRAPAERAALTVVGLDDEWAAPNAINLEVNGESVYSGPSPFANWDGVGNGADAAWTAATFTIPANMLRAGANEIALTNKTPGANFNAPPYILLADATLDLPAGAVSVTPLTNENDRKDKPAKNRAVPKEKGPKTEKNDQVKSNPAKPPRPKANNPGHQKAKKAKPAGKGGNGHGKQKGKHGRGHE